MRVIDSFRNQYLVSDYQGNPIAVLTAIDGATDKDLKMFVRAHVPNGHEDLINFAEYLERAVARKCRPEANGDERLRLINGIVDDFRFVLRYKVEPREPKPPLEPGERARKLSAEAEQRRQAAEEAVDPKLRKLLAKQREIGQQIAARTAELQAETSRLDAKADETRGAEQAEQPKTLADRFREYLRRQEADNPRKREAIAAGELKG
jgi:hypothetical protein